MQEGEEVEIMWGRFGRKRIFSGTNVVWLVLGGLIILTLLTRRHETADAVRAAYRTVRERFGGGGQEEQPSRQDTKGSSEEEDEVLVQEESREEETEGSTTEAEKTSSQGIRSIIRESVRRSEEGGGRKAEPQSSESTAAPEGSRNDAEGPPIEGYDSLSLSQVTQKLLEWSVEEVEQLRDYEAQNRNRPSIMQRFERRLSAARENLEKRGNGGAAEGSGNEMRRIIRESVERSIREGKQVR
jgi:hypothetical protein